MEFRLGRLAANPPRLDSFSTDNLALFLTGYGIVDFLRDIGREERIWAASAPDTHAKEKYGNE